MTDLIDDAEVPGFKPRETPWGLQVGPHSYLPPGGHQPYVGGRIDVAFCPSEQGDVNESTVSRPHVRAALDRASRLSTNKAQGEWWRARAARQAAEARAAAWAKLAVWRRALRTTADWLKTL